jgi:protein-S-isoprenylcysteine O-methyltransferase Ste14
VTNLLVIIGFLLATLATIELGDSMGVSPAYRGKVCRTGIYRWVKHPMYLGYAIADFSWVLVSPLNSIIYVVSCCIRSSE